MEAQPAQLDTSMIEFQHLPPPPELNEDLLTQLDTHFKGHWSASFQCVTMLRSICKTYPLYAPDIFSKYGPIIMDIFNKGAPQLIKNILKLLGQVFATGIEVNLQGCVNAFLPQLLKRAAMETGHIRQTCQQILTVIATKCCYCITVEMTTELSCDKNTQISQLAIKMLTSIITNLGGTLTQISPNTLQVLMRGLSCLVNGKRNNMKTSALDICIFIYNQIGSQNYLQLMNYSLNEGEVASMGQAMETHRIQKNKAPHLADVLKQHKMQMGGQPQNGGWGQNLRM